MKYYIRTNGYDMLVVDDGETRFVLTDDKWPEMHDMNPEEALQHVEDWSGWEMYEETLEELIQDSEILAKAEC